MKVATLIFLIRNINGLPQVLLALKERKIGSGSWNGYGGKMEPGDISVKDRALKELATESGGVVVCEEDLEYAGVLRGHFSKEIMGSHSWEVHIFTARKWKGEPRDSDEMKSPTWFSVISLPDKMIESDKVWIPRIVSGEKLSIDVYFGEDEKTIQSIEIRPLGE